MFYLLIVVFDILPCVRPEADGGDCMQVYGLGLLQRLHTIQVNYGRYSNNSD